MVLVSRPLSCFFKCSLAYDITVMSQAPAGVPEEGIKVQEINKKIENAFDIFDDKSNKTVVAYSIV